MYTCTSRPSATMAIPNLAILCTITFLNSKVSSIDIVIVQLTINYFQLISFTFVWFPSDSLGLVLFFHAPRL